MVSFYGRLARRLYPLRPVLWAVVAASVVAFAAALFLSTGTVVLMLALCVLLWSACLLVVVQTFVHPVPEGTGDAGGLSGLRVRLARGFRWLLTWVMTGLGIAVLVVSIRAVSLALRAGGA